MEAEKMHPQLKEAWLQALRSDEYKQGFYALKTGERFCCLGVLTDLYNKAHDTKWDGHDNFEYKSENGDVVTEKNYLAPPVCSWAGLPRHPGYDKGFPNVASMNDRGKTFSEIADVIEASF